MLEFSQSRLKRSAHPDGQAALAAQAKSDPAAFGRLYDLYAQPIYRYIRSRVQTVHEAEDLTSQTFISALENLRSYREQGYFSAWLFSIARSKLTDYYRAGRMEMPLEEVENRADGGSGLLGGVIALDEVRQLSRLLQHLRADEQELIRLRYIADLSFAEMAEVLGKREDAVKKSLYRLLAAIKGQME